jgi:pimeloyl-ACP methyl ester carboxylesterase
MRRKLALAALLIIALVGAGPAAAQGKVPRYDKAECPFPVPAGRPIECGYLTVREDRSDPASSTIRLAVAILRAKKPLADPVVFLEGGPGGYALVQAQRIFDNYTAFTADRDFIIYDQRGMGYSQPVLNCPEVTQFIYDTLDKDDTSAAIQSDYLQAIRDCRDNLNNEGINLWAYTTAASAADLNDMRTALGYRTWNLLGVSYGTRLALVTMRSFPQGLRSVVLDSTIPPNLEPGGGRTIMNAFDVLFNRCARDTQCNRSYRGLRNVFLNLVAKLRTNPVIVQVTHPTTQKQYNMMINGAAAVEAVFYALYSTRTIPYLPQMIFDAVYGDYSELAKWVFRSKVLSDETISFGAAMSIGCSENLYSGPFCENWDIMQFNRPSTRPVTSRLPTLVLAGEFDPVTPPSYGRTTVKTLSSGYYFEFPGMGHGVTFADDCPRRIMLAFLKTPTRKPDSSCISKLNEPNFARPDF